MVFNINSPDSTIPFHHIRDDFINDILYIWSYCCGYFLIAAMNIQPFKKVPVRYPSTDMVFYILLSLAYTGIIAREVARTEIYFFNTITLLFSLLTAFVPIVYIVSLISFWIISRLRWIVL